jgi:hypothetical protein
MYIFFIVFQQFFLCFFYFSGMEHDGPARMHPTGRKRIRRKSSSAVFSEFVFAGETPFAGRQDTAHCIQL